MVEDLDPAAVEVVVVAVDFMSFGRVRAGGLSLADLACIREFFVWVFSCEQFEVIEEGVVASPLITC